MACFNPNKNGHPQTLLNYLFSRLDKRFYSHSAIIMGSSTSQTVQPPADLPDEDQAVSANLSQEEQAIYEILSEVKRERKVAPRKIVVITDLAKDYDDLAALIVLKELHRLEFIQLVGVIANLYQASNRATFARGALNLLGLNDIPVACGTDGTEDYKQKLKAAFYGDPAITGKPDFADGKYLLDKIFSDAEREQEKIHLLCLSSLEDIFEYTNENKDRVAKTLASVHMQGGNFVNDGRLFPDSKAANNYFNFEAAIRWHEFLQDRNIRSYTYTKIAAFAVPLTTKLFKDMEASGHKIGAYLRETQVKQDQAFYETACEPDPKNRFAAHLDQTWFLKNRTTWYKYHTADEPPPGINEIKPYLKVVVVYDALAALGSGGDDVIKALDVFIPVSRELGSAESRHYIVGQSENQKGVKPEPLAIAISALMKGALLFRL
ncbi:hypothetical protein V8E54_012426 [Elaphomyces granulatus]